MANVGQSMTLSSQTTLELLLLIDRISSSGLKLGINSNGKGAWNQGSQKSGLGMVDDFCLWVFCFKIPIIQETKKRRKLTPENRRECEIATCFNLVSLMFKPFQKKPHILEKNVWKKNAKEAFLGFANSSTVNIWEGHGNGLI